MNPALYMGFPPILINSLDTALLATSITSTGKGNLPNFLTCFDSSTIQINFSDELTFEEFSKINDILDHNSWFAVMTSFLLNDNLFENWYYRRDPTHVVFYKRKTFEHIGFQQNWKVYFPTDNVVLFYKK